VKRTGKGKKRRAASRHGASSHYARGRKSNTAKMGGESRGLRSTLLEKKKVCLKNEGHRKKATKKGKRVCLKKSSRETPPPKRGPRGADKKQSKAKSRV